jgi:hypothetical protein
MPTTTDLSSGSKRQCFGEVEVNGGTSPKGFSYDRPTPKDLSSGSKRQNPIEATNNDSPIHVDTVDNVSPIIVDTVVETVDEDSKIIEGKSVILMSDGGELGGLVVHLDTVDNVSPINVDTFVEPVDEDSDIIEGKSVILTSDGRESGGLVDDKKQELDAIAREARERKATKADDAKVPEYLCWEDHLLNDGPTPWYMSDEDRPKLRCAMNLLRAWML